VKVAGTLIAVDGGNSKTDVLVLDADGAPHAYLRGRGGNAHSRGGAPASVGVIAEIVARAQLEAPAERGAFFLCGVDLPSDVAAIIAQLDEQPWVTHVSVANDTFALLRTGAERADAVAVICGAGINCVGRNARGDTAQYPSLGWETGDWGGSELLGREVFYHAARAEDGRGEPTALVDVVRSHFGAESVEAVGEDLHYGRIPQTRLRELAPAVVAAAQNDVVARRLVERLAEEIALMAWKALRDLGLVDGDADVVLGGGMLRPGTGVLHEEVVARLRTLAPRARPVVATDPPVLGAGLAVLEAAGAGPGPSERLRAAFRDGLAPQDATDATP
jgi:N-acetylglucosamine kinase-like BadF-type ATPase